MKRYALFFLVFALVAGCEIDTRQLDFQRVRFVTPDTYFPPEVQVKVKNVRNERLESPITFQAEYRSPMVDTTWWEKKIKCPNHSTVPPGKSWNFRCRFVGDNPSKDRKPNAAVYLRQMKVE